MLPVPVRLMRPASVMPSKVCAQSLVQPAVFVALMSAAVRSTMMPTPMSVLLLEIVVAVSPLKLLSELIVTAA